MFATVPKVRTVYESFWEILPFVLMIAEAKHGYPGLAAAAYWRVLESEVNPERGNTGFINGRNPAVCAKEYAAYIYGETNNKPDFLIAIEGR